MYTYSSLQQREDKKRISLQNVHGHAAFRCKSLNTLWIKENSWYQSTPYTFNICTRNVHELKFSHCLIILTFTKWFQNNLVHDKICTLFSFLMEQQWSVLYFFFNCEINNRYNKQLLVSSSGSALWLWHSDDREVLLTEKSLRDRGATQWNGQDPSNTKANLVSILISLYKKGQCLKLMNLW